MFRGRSRHRRAVVVGALLVTAAALLACPSTDLLFAGDGDAGIPAAPDAADVSDAGPMPTPDADCMHARVPPRPDASDGPDQAPLLFALRRLTLAPDAGADPLGYDLDGICQCDAGDAVLGCSAARAKTCHPGGRDVAATDVVISASVSGLYSPATFYDANNASYESGGGTTLFEIREYNGLPNDPRIKLVVYLSNGTWATDGADNYIDGGSIVPPKWDGTDRWSTAEGTTSPGLQSFEEVGWVSDGVAVVEGHSLPGGLVPLVRGGQLDIRDVRFSGRIVTVGGHLEIVDGQIAGRLAVSQLLGTLRLRPLGDGGCYSDDGLQYQATRAVICNARDVLALEVQNNPNIPCDALSYAAGFTAVAAIRVPTLHAGPPSCENARLDDSGCPP